MVMKDVWKSKNPTDLAHFSKTGLMCHTSGSCCPLPVCLLLLPPPLIADTASFIQLQYYVDFHSAPDELRSCYICCLSVSTTTRNSISLSSGKASKLARDGTSSSHYSVNSSPSCNILWVREWKERWWMGLERWLGVWNIGELSHSCLPIFFTGALFMIPDNW